MIAEGAGIPRNLLLANAFRNSGKPRKALGEIEMIAKGDGVSRDL